MNENKCPACGAALGDNVTECPYCGESVTPNFNGSVNTPNNFNTNNQYAGNNYSSLSSYYQQEFSKMDADSSYKGKWNWCSFFFSWLWAFTKGLWAIALIILGVNAIFGMTKISWIISLGLSIFIGLRGNYFYYNLIKTGKQFPKNL